MTPAERVAWLAALHERPGRRGPRRRGHVSAFDMGLAERPDGTGPRKPYGSRRSAREICRCRGCSALVWPDAVAAHVCELPGVVALKRGQYEAHAGSQASPGFDRIDVNKNEDSGGGG